MCAYGTAEDEDEHELQRNPPWRLGPTTGDVNDGETAERQRPITITTTITTTIHIGDVPVLNNL